MIRVFICGAHSTGKTTLLDSLLSDREPEIKVLHGETEVARKVIKNLGWKRDDFDPTKNPDRFYDLQIEILKAQSQVDKKNNDLKRSYVSDRGIDPLIYCKKYLGEGLFRELLDTEEARQCLERHKASNTLTVVLDPHCECIADDGIRLSPTLVELEEFTDLMKGFLKNKDIAFETISELNLETRVATMKSLIAHKISCNEVSNESP